MQTVKNKFNHLNHFENVCQFSTLSKKFIFPLIISDSLHERALKKLEILQNEICAAPGFLPWELIPLRNQTRPITRERISGGNQKSIIRTVGFRCFRSGICLRFARALITRMNDIIPQPRWHCNNAVYTPKSNFVIRSVDRWPV